MLLRSGSLTILAVLGLLAEPAVSLGAAQAIRPDAAGEAVFERVCAACHLSLMRPPQSPGTAAGLRAVPRELLRQFSPEAILNALTNGKMQAQAASLSDAERQGVAEYASGRAFGPAMTAPAESATINLCTDQALMGDPRRAPSWNGWGNGRTNARFQPGTQGKLTAADLPRLQLEWAFGYANVSSARPQPTIAGGRLFAASENGNVYALNPRTGCRYWTFKAQAGVPTAVVVGPYHDPAGNRGFALYFGDRKANAYAVDAQTGRQLWIRKADEHASAAITGSLAVADGRVFVPVQGLNEEATGGFAGYPCCTFRGSLSALEAGTGAVIWKTYTVGETEPRTPGKDGTAAFGPAGGGIWSVPTLDVRRGLVYVATGNGYAEPAQPTTDAVIAMDVHTGAVKWVRQVTANDDWTLGCEQNKGVNSTCPAALGPDFDFSAPPVLTKIRGRELLVLPQKSGIVWALDPADRGAIVWQYRFGQGSGLGGQWGVAVDGEHAYVGVADLLTQAPGGMRAMTVSDGHLVWQMPPQLKLCGTAAGCSAGQGGPLTAIPGAVLNGGMDGGLRAYSSKDGSILWSFDTNREFNTVNGVKANGGSMDSAGPVVVDGMLYVSSGAGGLVGRPGNVLLAFGLSQTTPRAPAAPTGRTSSR
ncbi:MAG: polyvinyl-alcohol dehydrogenase [Gammaproteobacteria bacterium]|nr:polyvinyl-alcohol dehydrogenase [Gammaproteobacteria bacterium]